ncbi:MAG TPA: hypothetical protein VK639_15345, partial [Terriglobales bacterium]|nr:hypothetical protein [Terriglobales bacterium]
MNQQEANYYMKTNLPIRNSINRSPFWRASILVLVAAACFAHSRMVRAGTDDEYRNFNTAEGQSALAFIITNSTYTGSINTAIGSFALADDTSG